MEIESKIRKWGNSYGVLLPKSFIEEEHLVEEDNVILNINSKRSNLKKLFGICKFKKSTNELMKEIKEGYDD